ncbi:hypothetical protein FRC17_010383 [Serendipita sp. 399]|nr:hypothetical protein FRC17_010383 [Serendipita sp. 399]
MDFLVEHGQQLESLSLHGVDLSSLMMQRDRLWEMFPKVETLGKQEMASFPTPPPDHPLRHLRIFSDHQSLDTGTIISNLNCFPRVSHVYLQLDDLEFHSVNELRARLIRRGIRIVEVPCMKRQTKRSRVFDLALMVGLAVTCPIWSPAFLCYLPIRNIFEAAEEENVRE